ncbi:hypothetical protein B842_07445 [Corynebacterium humireducens NBRC 106098 = DSM 45392]|uniref:Uncharacterized protein n=1 Tax=Corynebacterium humireducens NBRC 106098 = DSM 45392 TaxID=1223515 RepID=A0A0B5DB00_9CORY|nr:hypothetical protein B842_07445 [Corynebacterium humireducens NBRC 106098 = DSM 45392]
MSSTILLHTGQATANHAANTLTDMRVPRSAGRSSGTAQAASSVRPMLNQAPVSSAVAPSTGYSHQRTGTSRPKSGVGMMSEGMPMSSSVPRAASTP